MGLIRGQEVYLGADKRVVSGWEKRDSALAKVQKCGPVLVGWAGAIRPLQVLNTFLVLPPKALGHDALDFLLRHFVPVVQELFQSHGCLHVENGVTRVMEDSDCLLAVGNRLFRMDSAFQIVEHIEFYDAIGSGAPYALGALEALRSHPELPPEAVVRTAIKVASLFCASCGDAAIVLRQGVG